MIKKCISGGQTGADQGGLYAAELFDIPTGGWIPKGFLTEKGSDPALGSRFGLVETGSAKYPIRTRANVNDSDGTIRFARNFSSPGEICTFKAIKDFRKPYFDVNIRNPPSLETVVEWIGVNKVLVLNVAGNKESSCPGICEFTIKFLSQVFAKLGHERRL